MWMGLLSKVARVSRRSVQGLPLASAAVLACGPFGRGSFSCLYSISGTVCSPEVPSPVCTANVPSGFKQPESHFSGASWTQWVASEVTVASSDDSDRCCWLRRVGSVAHCAFALCVPGASGVADSATPWTVAHQAPLSMGFSRQEYWSGLPFPPPGGLLDPGTDPESLCLLHWQVGSVWEALSMFIQIQRPLFLECSSWTSGSKRLSLHPGSLPFALCPYNPMLASVSAPNHAIRIPTWAANHAIRIPTWAVHLTAKRWAQSPAWGFAP